MKSNVRCSTPPAAALLIAMLWLSACAMDGSDVRSPCPAMVEYSPGEQAIAASEVDVLAKGAMVVRMLSDYAVLRDQAHACK